MDIDIRDIVESCINVDTIRLIGFKCEAFLIGTSMQYAIHDLKAEKKIDLTILIHGGNILMIDWARYNDTDDFNNASSTINLADPEMEQKMKDWVWDKIG